MVHSLTDVEREVEGKRAEVGGGGEGGTLDYSEKTSILSLFYTFVESFILIILLFVQSWYKLLPFVESAY